MSAELVAGVLRKMDELYRALIELGKDKTQAIMDNDVASLTKVMSSETKIIKQAAQLDEEREQAVSAFLKEKGIRSQLNLTITEMTRLVFDIQEKQQLLDAQKQLTDTLNELKRVNSINKDLVDQSLTFIDYSLNLLTSEPEDEMLYRNPTVQQPANKPRSFFDTRA